MAHKKGEGSTQNGRDSNPKRLGVKLYGGQFAKAGNIIVRQRGTKFHPGQNVYMGKDYTLHAAVTGTVEFKRKKSNKTYVSIIPFEEVQETVGKIEKPQPPVIETVSPEAMPAVENAPVAEAVLVEVEQNLTPAAEAVVSTTAAEKITLPSGQTIKKDDLKIIEGIGPKIAELLQNAGITTWSDLANADLEKLREILAEAGSRYKMHDPATWAKQAQLAAAGEWGALQQYQDELKGGKETKSEE